MRLPLPVLKEGACVPLMKFTVRRNRCAADASRGLHQTSPFWNGDASSIW